MSTMALHASEVEQARQQWVETVEALAQQFSEWASEKNWQVQQMPRVINEEALGVYTVPDLTIDTPQGRVTMEAQPHGVPQATGRVELAAWPTLYRVWLMCKPGIPDWIIRTDSGIPLHYPWSKDTFITLVEDLVAAE